MASVSWPSAKVAVMRGFSGRHDNREVGSAGETPRRPSRAIVVHAYSLWNFSPPFSTVAFKSCETRDRRRLLQEHGASLQESRPTHDQGPILSLSVSMLQFLADRS